MPSQRSAASSRPRRKKGAARRPAAAPQRALQPLKRTGEKWVSQPQQSRSQQTLTRLVEAGARLMEERPFAAVTVSDIVAEAQSSVGSFYARFGDKDAYLAFLHEHYQRSVVEGIDTLLDPERVAGMPIGALLGEVVPAFVDAHRDMQGLMRALHAQAAVDPDFRKREEELNRHIALSFARVLLQHADAIGHPDPERAIDFAVISLLGALIQRVFFEGPGALPFDDAQYTEHLVHAFMAHLQVQA